MGKGGVGHGTMGKEGDIAMGKHDVRLLNLAVGSKRNVMLNSNIPLTTNILLDDVVKQADCDCEVSRKKK